MTKWIIIGVGVIIFIAVMFIGVDAYTKIDAYDKLCDLGPERDVQAVEVEVIGDHIIHEETINEYEYNKDWKPQRKHDTPSGFVCWPAPPLGGAFPLGKMKGQITTYKDQSV